jgi:SPP1 gp7 family putative phage head morphogenesis protein
LPTYLQLINSFKDRLDQREQTAVEELQSYYLPLLQKIIKEFDEVVEKIISLQSQEKNVSKELIYRETRYRETVSKLVKEITAIDKKTVREISSVQREVATTALHDAEVLIKKSVGKIPRSFDFDRAFLQYNHQAALNMVSRLSKGTPLREILDANVPDIMLASQAFVESIVKGEHPRVLRDKLYKQWGMSYVRAETTARTEIVSSYRDSNIWRYKQSKTVEAWQWSATLDDRTCPVCIFMDGQVFSLDTPFATHPNCRCSPLPVTKTWKELGLNIPEFKPDIGPRGVEWFQSLPENRQLKILHPQKFDLWKSGRITLENLVDSFDHPKYGPSREERSIKELYRLGILR